VKHKDFNLYTCMAILILGSLFMLVSCGSETSQKAIIGRWRYVQSMHLGELSPKLAVDDTNDANITYEYFPEGTVTLSVNEPGEPAVTGTGNYKIIDETHIRLDIDGASTVFEFHIEGDQLSLGSKSSGEMKIYGRVK
jgi:hypothetical protein